MSEHQERNVPINLDDEGTPAQKAAVEFTGDQFDRLLDAIAALGVLERSRHLLYIGRTLSFRQIDQCDLFAGERHQVPLQMA